MKSFLKSFFIFSLLVTSFNSYAAEDKRVSHVVIAWLKAPGNIQMRDEFIQASRQLETAPGVLSRHVSAVIESNRPKVDDTFDVAVTVTFKNKKALKNYMQSKQHKKLLHDKLKPLVNRIVVYNFGNQ
jgi:heme-degrading monooxygenase HmoA